MNELSIAAEYKVNIQKWIIFLLLYMSHNYKIKFQEMNKTVASKRIKFLELPNKFLKYFYTENYNLLLRRNKRSRKMWGYKYSWTRRVNIVKIPISSNLNIQFNPKEVNNIFWEAYSNIYMEMKRGKN